MKKNILTIALYLLITGVFAQKMNPKQYALIDVEMLTGKKTGFMPGQNQESMAFNSNGNYLFLVNSDAKTEGRLIVYSTQKKRVEKIFKMSKTGLYAFYGKVICNPTNTYQLAVITSKEEIKVIQNWETAPEDILLQKSNENSVTIKAKVSMGQMAFSDDGKSLFMIQNDSEVIEAIDLASGKVVKKVLPDKKTPFIKYGISTFIEKDEIIVVNNSKNTVEKSIEIYNLTTNQFVRKYDYDLPSGSTFGDPSIVSFEGGFGIGGYTMNLRSGYIDKTYKRIQQSLDGEKTSLTLSKVNTTGYVVNYLYYDRKTTTKLITTTTKSGLFFFDKDGNNVLGYFPAVNTKIPNTSVGDYQISPNGKFIVFEHRDKDDDSNDRLVIATLY